MRAAKILPQYTIADYLRWEGEWELIDGIPWAMSPSPTKRHSRVLLELTRHIGNMLAETRKTCADCELVSELDWRINEETVLKPDIAIVCNDKGNYITTPPLLIIEILSPSTALKDRNSKFKIYEEQQVTYYFIVEPETLRVEFFVLQEGKYKAVESSPPSIQLPEGCTLAFDFEKVFAEID